MRIKKIKMTQAVLRIPKEYVDLAKEIGKKELRSYSSVLRRAIVEWL